jgi:hypothetical protein
MPIIFEHPQAALDFFKKSILQKKTSEKALLFKAGMKRKH